MKLIVGLGNPGKLYSKTRHNAGFFGADEISAYFNFDRFKKSEKHFAELAEGKIAGKKVLLAKPQTLMNLSGQSVRSVMQFYKIPNEDLIVISDDVTLPSGTLRIRKSGSAGGHNGLKSIIQELGSDEFIRIRLGIEPVTPFRGNLEDYVLGKFADKEESLMDDNMKILPKLIETLLKEGIEETMQEYN